MPIKIDSRTGKKFFMLTGIRLSYFSGFEKTKVKKESVTEVPKYRSGYLILKTDPQALEFGNFIKDVMKEALPDEWERVFQQIKNIPQQFPLFREGALLKTPQPDFYYGSVASETRPMIVDADGKTPLTRDDNRPYSGCVADLSLDVYYSKTQKGLFGSLRGIRFVKDGDRFGGGAGAAEDEFADAADTGVTSPAVDPLA